MSAAADWRTPGINDEVDSKRGSASSGKLLRVLALTTACIAIYLIIWVLPNTQGTIQRQSTTCETKPPSYVLPWCTHLEELRLALPAQALLAYVAFTTATVLLARRGRRFLGVVPLVVVLWSESSRGTPLPDGGSPLMYGWLGLHSSLLTRQIASWIAIATLLLLPYLLAAFTFRRQKVPPWSRADVAAFAIMGGGAYLLLVVSGAAQSGSVPVLATAFLLGASSTSARSGLWSTLPLALAALSVTLSGIPFALEFGAGLRLLGCGMLAGLAGFAISRLAEIISHGAPSWARPIRPRRRPSMPAT